MVSMLLCLLPTTSNKDEIKEVESNFESKDKLYYKKGIEKLKECWTECIIFKREP